MHERSDFGLGPVANTDTKLLIYALFQKGRVLAQDGNAARLGSRSEQYDVRAISYGLERISYLLLSSEARPHRTRTGMGQGYALVSHSGTHLFHRIEATQSKARRQIVSDMTPEEMKKELERLQAENETLKKRSEKELSLKVSQKGGVSVYGLGRFPVTLYKEQWEKLLKMTDDIRAFIQENKAQLKTKDS